MIIRWNANLAFFLEYYLVAMYFDTKKKENQDEYTAFTEEMPLENEFIESEFESTVGKDWEKYKNQSQIHYSEDITLLFGKSDKAQEKFKHQTKKEYKEVIHIMVDSTPFHVSIL